MPAIELSVGTLDYIDTGDGPVIVFVHGLVMDANVWSNVIAALRADHRCVAPTLPLGAHQRPMHRDADLSMTGQARLLAEFIDRLDLDDVTLVVNDWGGPLVTAVDHPGRIGRLVVTPCEVFDNLPPGLPGKFAAFAARMPGGLAFAAQTLRPRFMRRQPTTFGWMARDPIPRQLFDPWILGLRKTHAIRRDVARYVRTTRRDTLEQIVDRLRVLPIPVLVAWGDHGKVMPVEHGRRLAELVPDGRYVEIPNARVLVQLDEPGHVADLIRSFLIERPGTVGTAAAGRTG